MSVSWWRTLMWVLALFVLAVVVTILVLVAIYAPWTWNRVKGIDDCDDVVILSLGEKIDALISKSQNPEHDNAVLVLSNKIDALSAQTSAVGQGSDHHSLNDKMDALASGVHSSDAAIHSLSNKIDAFHATVNTEGQGPPPAVPPPFVDECGCPCDSANMDTITEFRDASNQFTSSREGFIRTADPSVAVGPDRVVENVNVRVIIRDKATNAVLNSYPAEDFWGTPICCDQSVIYDFNDDRFIMVALFTVTNMANCTVDAPPEIAQTFYGRPSNAFVGSYDFNAEVFLADPDDASAPITNPLSETSGKIALVRSGNPFSPGSVTKTTNCKTGVGGATGIAGVLIYDERPGAEGRPNGGIFGIADVPAVACGGNVGQDIIGQLELNETVSVTLQNENVISFGYTPLAVSKSSSPTSKEDWFFYSVGSRDGPAHPYDFSNNRPDLPQVGVDEAAIYINSHQPQDLNFPFAPNIIVAMDKVPLLDGTAPQFPAILPPAVVPYVEFIPQPPPWPDGPLFGTQLTIPSILRPPKTHAQHVTFGISVPTTNASASQISVHVIQNPLTTPIVSDFILDVDPWDGVDGSPLPQIFGFPPVTVQPQVFSNAFGQLMISTILNPNNFFYPDQAIWFNDSLWCVQVVPNQGRWEGRWYEIDTTQLFSVANPRLTLRQEGTIFDHNDPTTSISFARIEVDGAGSASVAFLMNGPNKFITHAHTGRLVTDPLGSMRLPYQEANDANGVVYVANLLDFAFIIPDFGLVVFSTFNDFAFIALDPVDKRTFTYYSQYVNLSPDDLVTFFNATGWTTAWHTWQINEGCGDSPTHSDTDTEPLVVNAHSNVVPHAVDLEAGIEAVRKWREGLLNPPAD